MPFCKRHVTGDDCSQDIAKHADRLTTDFDLVSKSVDVRSSKSATLPSSLNSKILTGIEKGIAEARSNGYCPKWSKVDESFFRNVMLKNIAAEAAPEARDRVPLGQFNGLYESYKALHIKLVAQLPPNAISHQSGGADAPISGTSVSGLVDLSRGTNTALKSVRTSGKPVTGPQEKKCKDVTEKKSDNASNGKVSEEGKSKQKESKGQDAGDGQAVSDSEDSESGCSSNEDSSDDSSSFTEEENEAQNHSDIKEAKTQDIVKDPTGSTAIFNIKIEHQASVNQIYRMTNPERMECISLSFKKFLHMHQLPSQDLSISSGSLIVRDTGDLQILVHANTREALQQFLDSAEGWDPEFERKLTGPTLPGYQLIMHKVEKSSMSFQDRIGKSKIIQDFEFANRAIGNQSGDRLIIRDISWAPESLHRTASLLVEFQDSKHANQAMAHGLNWRGMRHGCERADREGRLLRCGRCQAYGHLGAKCTTTFDRCGKCSEHHDTRTCKSKVRKCASCGGGHRAGNKQCPEKIKAKKNLEFKNENTSQSANPPAKTDRTPSSGIQRSASTHTKASMPSPVSLGAASSEDQLKSEFKPPLPKAETAKHQVKSKSEHPLPEAKTAESNVEFQSKQPLPKEETAKHKVESNSKQPLPGVKTAKELIESQ